MVIETINTTSTMDIFTATTILVIIARLQDTHPIHLYSILKVQCPQLDWFTVIQEEISDECIFPGLESKQVNFKLQATWTSLSDPHRGNLSCVLTLRELATATSTIHNPALQPQPLLVVGHIDSHHRIGECAGSKYFFFSCASSSTYTLPSNQGGAFEACELGCLVIRGVISKKTR